MADQMPPTQWKKGDDIRSADRHNETVDVARKRAAISVTGGSIVSGVNGTSINIRDDTDRYPDVRYGFLVNTGPNGEVDFATEVYWIKTAFIINKDPADSFPGTSAVAFEFDPVYSQAEPYPLSVTNLPEITGHKHGLIPIDGTRVVRFWRETDDAGNFRWIMNEGGMRSIGQYQGMLDQMVTQNVLGFDYLFSHALDT